MELHLIRHGQTDWNEERRVQGQSESQLTALGVEQARSLAQRIADLHLDIVYCSSSLRTRQTAEHLFADRDIAIRYLDSLREIALGPWEGTLYDDLQASDPDSYRHFWEEPHLFAVDGAETFYQLQDRAVAAVHQLADEHPGKRVAVVSHGALIKTVLAHTESLPMSQLWRPPLMHNCAHSVIEFRRDGSRRIVQYADRPHPQED